ncbi:hypothetical protein PV10_00726 [Exophiala mesophila]|uniref:Uncharacterized protein n=1 Tax=Exophiala mesophila TaxID=212818 RepID=A0A0D2ADD1_EXOME|nr:uncharacterized protein PV10_00726 [Exophiala mesophila]KIV96913.1 hypothetical protein PV10_00726 [Exophiala mesophila]
MSDRRQTPAPPRRFLPSSTSSSHTSATQPSFRRTPFQSSRQSQITQSASPYTVTPRFSRPGVLIKDDIDSSLEDRVDDGGLPSSSEITTTKSPLDLIDAGPDLDSDHGPDSSPLVTRIAEQRHEDHDKGKGEHCKPSFRRRLISTTPAAKKQKTSHHPGAQAQTEAIAVSSSPEYSEVEGLEDSLSSHKGSHSAASIDDDLDDPYDQHETATIPRFKGPAGPEPFLRSTFRPKATDDRDNQSASEIVLPDIFSPSKRRGKHDYLPGGNAELVRNWVLNVAAHETPSPRPGSDIIVVDRVHRDISNRLLTIYDEVGVEWLLPTQHADSRVGKGADLAAVHSGSKILIKGQATNWSIPFSKPNAKDLFVVAHWEILT